MSKLEFIDEYLKNAKINTTQLKRICQAFSCDLNASQTAKKLGLSRQTINSYFKVIRTALITEENYINNFFINNTFDKTNFVLRYINSHSQIIYYIEFENKIFLLESDNKKLNEIDHFVKENIKNSLINHKKANSSKILFSKVSNEYLVANYIKSDNSLNEYIDQRLKKFRGINKNNHIIHIKESIIRFNNTQESLYNTLSRIFNL